jgi:transketolase
MRNEFVKALTQIAASDGDVMLLTGDLGFGVLTDFARRFPSQFLNVGVAEQNMIGIAVGLALEGRTVFAYSIGNFPTLRCLEQIRNDACYHNANVKIVAVGGGFTYGSLGISHHATEDIAVMRSIPGMTVMAPGDPKSRGSHDGCLPSTAPVPAPRRGGEPGAGDSFVYAGRGDRGTRRQ